MQAASTSYFEKLIRYTELFSIEKIILPNPENTKNEKASVIVLSKSKTKIITDLLIEFDKNITYDFKGNLSLWMNYIGNPLVKKTPRDFSVFTSRNENILITISQNDKNIFADLVNKEKDAIIPIIETYNYSINIINPDNGSVFSEYKFNSKHSEFLSIKAMGLNISKDEQYQVIIEYPDKTVSTINLQY